MPLTDLLTLTAMYGIGSTLIHSAACVWSDICDIEFDRQVGRLQHSSTRYINMLALLSHSAIERTKNRPLISGRASLLQSYVLLFGLTTAFVSSYSLLNSNA